MIRLPAPQGTIGLLAYAAALAAWGLILLGLWFR